MVSRWVADLTVVLHLAFVLFVIAGGLLALRWPWVIRWHLPAMAWGVLIEFMGWSCPLTALENWLRARGHEPTYEPDFIQDYLLPVLYPASLTHTIQLALGSALLLINGAVYLLLWRRSRSR
jgi:hypothetical protein